MIVFEHVRVLLETVAHGNLSRPGIDRQDLTLEESNVPKHFADGVDDMSDIEVTAGNFMEHCGKQEEIILTDLCHIELWVATPFKLECRINASKSAAENEYSGLFHLNGSAFWIVLSIATPLVSSSGIKSVAHFVKRLSIMCAIWRVWNKGEYAQLISAMPSTLRRWLKNCSKIPQKSYRSGPTL